MNASHLSQLASLAEDVAAIDGGVLAGVIVQEMGDGSGRSVALVDTIDAGLEQRYRISSPAPAGAPAWASGWSSWLVELRIGDDWMELELGVDDDELLAPAPAAAVSRADAASAAQACELLAGLVVSDPDLVGMEPELEALAGRLRAVAVVAS